MIKDTAPVINAKNIDQVYSVPHRNHDPYNYSEKTSSESSDDYFDQVDGRNPPLDSSEDDTYISSDTSEDSIIESSDDGDIPDMFELSKGKAGAHYTTNKNSQSLNQKTHSRQIAKNKWRK